MKASILKLFCVSIFALGCGNAGIASDPVENQKETEELSEEALAALDYPEFKRIALPSFPNITVPVYKSAGSQGPTLLLVHGNSSSSRSYVFQMLGLLGKKHRVFAIDLPGYGKASKVDASRPFPVDANGVPVGFAEYQLGLIQAIASAANDPAINAQIAVGWSLGGDLLLLTQGAGLLPQVKGLFMFGTAPTGAAPPTAELPFLPPNVPGLPLSILASFGFAFNPTGAPPLGFSLDGKFSDPVPPYAPAPISNASNVGRAYLSAFFKQSVRQSGVIPSCFVEDGFNRTDSRARGSIGAAALGLLPPGSLPDELQVLRGLQGNPSTPNDDVRIGVALGSQDAFVNPAYLNALKNAGAIPTLWRNQIHVFQGAGHAAHFEAPIQFNLTLRAFMNDVIH